MGKLDGKVAVLTGAASGIGRATALKMAEEGAKVVVADINADGARAVVAEIGAAGGTAIAQATDVADERAVERMVAAAVDRFGRLDVLFNNAAAVSPEFLERDTDVVTIDLAVWDRTMAVNLRGMLLGCKYGIPEMLKTGGGAIINTASGAAFRGDSLRVAYGTSKAGVVALTKFIATMYGKQGVRCNAVAPGLVLTPLARKLYSPEQLAVWEARHLTPRLGEPADIANLVVFLASDEAAFVTGQTILVDGGLLTHLGRYLLGPKG